MEVLIEEQTAHLDQKNKKMVKQEVEIRGLEASLETLQQQVRRTTLENDENRKKLMQAEVRIKQLTMATLKDLKSKIREKDAEIDVLKEMVKSANI